MSARRWVVAGAVLVGMGAGVMGGAHAASSSTEVSTRIERCSPEDVAGIQAGRCIEAGLYPLTVPCLIPGLGRFNYHDPQCVEGYVDPPEVLPADVEPAEPVAWTPRFTG